MFRKTAVWEGGFVKFPEKRPNSVPYKQFKLFIPPNYNYTKN